MTTTILKPTLNSQYRSEDIVPGSFHTMRKAEGPMSQLKWKKLTRREVLAAALGAGIAAVGGKTTTAAPPPAEKTTEKPNDSLEDKQEVLFRWVLERHPEPVLRTRPGTWESQWFALSNLIRVNGRIRMYYEASSPKSIADSRLGVAHSDDGVTWHRYEGNPIWEKEGNWTHFLRDVRVHQFDGEEGYWMYYSDGDQHINLAYSTEGIHWKNSEHNPVLTISQPWEGHVMQESVLKLGPQKWYMWYSTYYAYSDKLRRNNPRMTGFATSTDGIHWTKHKDNPIFLTGKPGEWDDYSAFQPTVFRQDGYFHMLYTGSSKGNGIYSYRWGYAWSKDGIHWTKSPDNPILVPGPKGAWDGGKVASHEMYRTGPNTFNIYYGGAPTPEDSWCIGIGLVRARLEKVGK